MAWLRWVVWWGSPLGPHRLHAGIGQYHLQITVSVSTASLPCWSVSWSWAELWKIVREWNLAQDPTTVFAYSLGLVSSSLCGSFCLQMGLVTSLSLGASGGQEL